MNRFRKILVFPIELRRTDPAVATAADMAERTGAELFVASVWPSSDRSAETAQARELWRLERERASERLVAELHGRGLTVRAHVLTDGDTVPLLLAHIQKWELDLVIKTAREADVPTGRVYSTVATRLLQRSPCPVWIVRPRQQPGAARVLAAVGPFGGAYEAQKADSDVLDVATQLAAARGGELHLVSAWYPLMMRRYLSAEDYRVYVRSCKLDAVEGLRQLLAAHPTKVAWKNVHVKSGPADQVIARVADEIDADVIVVGSAGRTGLRRWIMGNTVEDVLRQTERATLGVRAAEPA